MLGPSQGPEGLQKGNMRLPTARLTLTRIFVATIAGITTLVAGLFFAFLADSRRSTLESARVDRESAALRVEARVEAELSRTERAVQNIERAIRHGAGDASSGRAIEPLLFTELLQAPELRQIELTRARAPLTAPAGSGAGAAQGPWQISVYRAREGAGSPIFTQLIEPEPGGFVRELRVRPAEGDLRSGALRVLGAAGEPAAPELPSPGGAPAPTGVRFGDLRYAATDSEPPGAPPQVVLDAGKALQGAAGAAMGAVTVSLSTEALEAIVDERVDPRDRGDLRHVFLCDTAGRLVTRSSPLEAFVEAGGSLRVAAQGIPAEVAAALRSPILRGLHRGDHDGAETLQVDGRAYLATFHPLRHPRGWIVGIVVREDSYVAALMRLRDRFLVAYGVVSALILVGGLFAVRTFRRGLRLVLETTSRMRHFDFTPTHGATSLGDVQEVMDGLERAKTVVRTMGKYLPLDVVRELFDENREPILGGEPRELTLMFTDIQGFTRLSEQLTPAELTRVLGLYFETLASAITGSGGTIDKFIGDSIMAFWNAPGACLDHPAAACRAVLSCLEATRRLYASEAWGGRAPLHTRFGVNTDRALVGHFGAPSRLSYTAMGDAVNVAARLESLCKQYGVAVLVSDAVELGAREQYVFRRVDVVTVVGKTRAIGVYELLGARGEELPDLPARRAYERAFERYLARDFPAARALFAALAGDGPSVVMAERCARYEASPPPPGWDGSFHADLK